MKTYIATFSDQSGTVDTMEIQSMTKQHAKWIATAHKPKVLQRSKFKRIKVEVNIKSDIK